MGKLSTMQESRATGYPNDYSAISYDFQAPIGESGYLRESYYRLQTLFLFLQSFGGMLAPMTTVYPNRRPTDLADTETLRCCMRSNGREGFLFVNNHHHGIRLPEHRDVKIPVTFVDKDVLVEIPVVPSDTSFVFPVRMRMSGRVCLEYALAQPISVKGTEYEFELVEGIEPLFCFADGSRQLIYDRAVVEDVTIRVRPRRMPIEEAGVPLKFRQKGTYCWAADEIPEAAGKIRIQYYGDAVSVYGDGKLISDQLYYGDFHQFYKPKGISSLEIRIRPLEPEKDVYLECERKNGGALEKLQYFSWKA